MEWSLWIQSVVVQLARLTLNITNMNAIHPTFASRDQSTVRVEVFCQQRDLARHYKPGEDPPVSPKSGPVWFLCTPYFFPEGYVDHGINQRVGIDCKWTSFEEHETTLRHAENSRPEARTAI